MDDDLTKRVIEHFTPPDGRPVAFVPLGLAGEKGLAVIFEDDLEMMVGLGLSLKWNRHHRTGIQGQWWQCASGEGAARSGAC